MTSKGLYDYAAIIIKKYPGLRKEVFDILDMAISEIRAGESENHECELAYDYIKQLVETYIKENNV